MNLSTWWWGCRWGRRRAVQGACVVNVVVVVGMTLVPFYSLIITLRFVAGFSIMAMLVPAWSLSEFLSNGWIRFQSSKKICC